MVAVTLTAAQYAARDGKLTASRVACLMRGDEAAILNLWREMVGDPSFVAEDLSGVWPVQLGVATEPLNLAWYARKTGRQLTRQGEVVIHPRAGWAAATLDAWDDALPGPIEAKHVGGREPLATIVARYQPQIHWQMMVTEARQAAFTIIEGANEPVVENIPFDERYAAELWSRAEAFMRCVETLTPPFAVPAIAAPTIPERIVDLTGDNEWADHAATWRENAAAKKKAETAEKALKAKVPSDAARCFGHGVTINRDRAGRLSLRELTT